MYITAMTHREELFDLTLRWLNNRFDPADGLTVTRIFFYESAILAVVVDRIIRLLAEVLQTPLQAERIHQKQVLRERLIQYIPHQNRRIHQLIQSYTENPEYYFPRLPIDAVVLTAAKARLVSIGRIKQLARVAEKVSYRLVDALFREIQAEARRNAAQRAQATGVTLEKLISSPEAMHKDFVEAEATVARRFKYKNIRFERRDLIVNDLLGFKIIGNPDLLEQIPDRIRQSPALTLFEIEKHSGMYNAVNLLVDIAIPSPENLARDLAGFDWSQACRCGLDKDETRRTFIPYTAQGANSVRFEIILTTYPELMESELGRSMHELRLLRLRQRQAYIGPVAQNAASLVEFLLALAVSPTTHIEELPVKMFGRYLPETIIAAKNVLFGHGGNSGFVNAFALLSPELLKENTTP